jgi:hypothetical protein
MLRCNIPRRIGVEKSLQALHNAHRVVDAPYVV